MKRWIGLSMAAGCDDAQTDVGLGGAYAAVAFHF